MSTGYNKKGTLKVALGALDTAGGVLSLANPEGVDLIITKLVLDITTPSTGACTIDAGVAANGTTLNDTLIDGLDANAAVITAGNPYGSNGKAAKKWSTTQYVTASVASGAAAGLVGYAYVDYIHA